MTINDWGLKDNEAVASTAGEILDTATSAAFLGFLAARDRSGALAFVNALRLRGASSAELIETVLAPAQRTVGGLWESGEWSVSQEHAATAIVEAVLATIPTAPQSREPSGSVVLACCEHEWHSLPAKMLADLLRSRGWDVTFLGASTAADGLGDFLRLADPICLVASCSVSMNLFGAARLIDAAHASGYRVLVGGAALTSARRATALGADAWATSIDDADRILTDWRDHPGPPRSVARPGSRAAWAVVAAQSQLVDLTLQALRTYDSSTVPSDDRGIARLRTDLGHIVAFASAGILVGDDTVFDDFFDWLNGMSTRLGTPNFTRYAFEQLSAVAAEHHPELVALLVRSSARLREPVDVLVSSGSPN